MGAGLGIKSCSTKRLIKSTSSTQSLPVCPRVQNWCKLGSSLLPGDLAALPDVSRGGAPAQGPAPSHPPHGVLLAWVRRPSPCALVPRKSGPWSSPAEAGETGACMFVPDGPRTQ